MKANQVNYPYIPIRHPKGTKENYLERKEHLKIKIDEIEGLIAQKADKQMVKEAVLVLVQFYDDMEGWKAYFRDNDPALFSRFNPIFISRRKMGTGIVLRKHNRIIKL